jgi:hypothetical protein
MQPWTCIRVRNTLGRAGVDAERAARVGCAPGSADAVPVAVGMARTGHFVRYAVWCTRGRGLRDRSVRGIGDREILAWAWHISDDYGRDWIREAAEDFFHMDTAVSELRERTGELRGSRMEPVLDDLAARSAAAMDGPSDDLPRYWPGTASLSEALWLEGMRQVVRTLAADTGEEARQRAFSLADFGHHLMYAGRVPAPFAALLTRDGLRYAWRVADPDTCAWALRTAESLGLRKSLVRTVGRKQLAEGLAPSGTDDEG